MLDQLRKEQNTEIEKINIKYNISEQAITKKKKEIKMEEILSNDHQNSLEEKPEIKIIENVQEILLNNNEIKNIQKNIVINEIKNLKENTDNNNKIIDQNDEYKEKKSIQEYEEKKEKQEDLKELKMKQLENEKNEKIKIVLSKFGNQINQLEAQLKQNKSIIISS